MQRYRYSLDLLRQVIAKAPKFFPEGRTTDMLAALAAFERDPQTSRSAIESSIAAFGQEIWPFRKAFWHIHDTDGRHDEDAYLREGLSPALREKYEQFVKKGHRIEDVRSGGEFELFFTPDEKHALIEAKLAAHEKVIAGIEDLCAGVHKETCEDALGRYRLEQQTIAEQIGELKAYAGRSEKWSAEIEDKVKTFEAGWSGLEKEVSAADVEGEIDYYKGIIEIFE